MTHTDETKVSGFTENNRTITTKHMRQKNNKKITLPGAPISTTEKEK